MLAVAVATLLQIGVHQVIPRAHFMAFIPAILVAAMVGGRAIGMGAVVLCSILASLIMRPQLMFFPTDQNDVFSLIQFAITCTLIVWLSGRLRSAVEEARLAGRSTQETLETITDAFLTIDENARCTYANTRVELLANRPSSQAVGMLFWDLFPGTAPAVREGFERSQRDRVPAEFESFYEPWGLWFLYKLYPRGAGGLSVSFRDISVEKRAIEDLRDSERRFREVLDLVPAMVWTAQPGGELEYISKAWSDHTGIGLEETLREGWISRLHPDDREGFRSGWARAVETGKPYSYEHRVRGFDGRYRWYVGRAVPLTSEENQVVKWFGTGIDNTDLRRLREEADLLADAGLALSASSAYQETLDNLARLVVPRLADWCLIDVASDSGEMERMTLVHSDATRIKLGEEMQRLYPPDPSAPHGRHEVLRTGQSEWTFQITDEMLVATARDEKHLALLRELGLTSYACVPLKARGQTLGTLVICFAESGRVYNESDVRLAEELGRRAGVAVDNARLRQSEQRLLIAERASRVEAEQAGILKDEFLATLSHELRTPLNAILGWSQLLRQGGETTYSEDLRQGLETIERNARVQTQIIEDLLDMSRIVSGKLALELHRVDLVEEVESAVKALEPSAQSKGLKVIAVLPGSPAEIMGDSARLQQVLWNLLSNAIKFTPQGGRVEVKLERQGPRVEVSVRDTGQGIKAEFLPHIFERFRQQDGSITRRQGGLGLGLSIASQLVERQGGRLRAQSAGEGCGSTLTMDFPQAPEEEIRPVFQSADSPSRTVDLAGVAILVVDDDKDAQELVRRVLVGARAQVCCASSAQEALQQMSRAPELLISDIGMPDKDGYQLIREVRARTAEEGGKIPAVALTAFARAEDRTRALEAGYTAHLTKPIEPDELLATVVEVLGLIYRSNVSCSPSSGEIPSTATSD